MSSVAPAVPAPREFWSRHLPRRRSIAAGAWILGFAAAAAANIAVRVIDGGREGGVPETWKFAVWETTSALGSLAVLPLLLALCARWPLQLDGLARRLPLYVAASLAWCVLHVAGMVALRHAAYAMAGDTYDFDWLTGLPYEYLKDVRTFALVVLLTHGHAWLWRRLQGEARLLESRGPDAAGTGIGTERFLVRKLGREFLVDVADVESVQAAGNYVNLRVAGRDYPLRATMAAMETRLAAAGFVRVHRSHLINLACLESVRPLESGDAVLRLRSGEEIPCGRRHRHRLRPERSGANHRTTA